jgi:hypothetical protein
MSVDKNRYVELDRFGLKSDSAVFELPEPF